MCESNSSILSHGVSQRGQTSYLNPYQFWYLVSIEHFLPWFGTQCWWNIFKLECCRLTLITICTIYVTESVLCNEIYVQTMYWKMYCVMYYMCTGKCTVYYTIFTTCVLESTLCTVLYLLPVYWKMYCVLYYMYYSCTGKCTMYCKCTICSTCVLEICSDLKDYPDPPV